MQATGQQFQTVYKLTYESFFIAIFGFQHEKAGKRKAGRLRRARSLIIMK